MLGKISRVVFVYNEEDSLIGMVRGYLRPELKCCDSHEDCSSCAMTSNLGTKSAWITFVNESEHPVVFMSPEELRDKYQTMWERFPMVFIDNQGKLEKLVGTDEINQCRVSSELLTLVQRKLAEIL